MSQGNLQILADHKRCKTRFIPPMTYKLGGFKETSWVKEGIPELFWISLLNHMYGVKEGADIALKFTRKCVEECNVDPKPIIAPMSSFNTLSDQAKRRIREYILTHGLKEKMLSALGGLLAYYPKCPLNFICEQTELEEYKTPESIDNLKNALEPLFYKLEKEPVFTQATLFYLGSIQGKIHVASHLSLANFPEIEKYPDTELSQQIASGVRAMASMYLGKMDEENLSHEWADYFWNRGLEIDPCSYAEDES